MWTLIHFWKSMEIKDITNSTSSTALQFLWKMEGAAQLTFCEDETRTQRPKGHLWGPGVV